MQLPPTAMLAHVIKHFLIIESDAMSNRTLRMFSDGNTGMVFNYKDPLLFRQSDEPDAPLPSCFLYGPSHRFQDITSTGRIGMLVVVFHPFALSPMLRIPANILIDQLINLETFYHWQAGNLSGQLCSAQDSLERIQVVEEFFLKKIASFRPVNADALHAVRLIQQLNGDVSVSQLLSSLKISERKLQRVFEENIGFSPKRFAGIAKVQYFLKLLRQNRPVNYTSLVYEAGFFDQAHLIRTMKDISGITPGEYLSQSQQLLAANLLEVAR